MSNVLRGTLEKLPETVNGSVEHQRRDSYRQHVEDQSADREGVHARVEQPRHRQPYPPAVVRGLDADDPLVPERVMKVANVLWNELAPPLLLCLLPPWPKLADEIALA